MKRTSNYLKLLVIALVILPGFAQVLQAASALYQVKVNYQPAGSSSRTDKYFYSSGAILREYNTHVSVTLYRPSAMSGSSTYTYIVNGSNQSSSTTTGDSSYFYSALGAGDPDAQIYCHVDPKGEAGYTAGSLFITVNSQSPQEPDLIVDTVRVNGTTAPRDYRVGEVVAIDLIVYNVGQGSAGSSRVGYYIGTSSTDLSGRWAYDSTSELAYNQGDDESENYTFTADDVGRRYFVFTADYRSEVEEDTESNNTTYFGPFNVLPALPGTAGSPVPAEASTDAPLTGSLSWSPASAASSYDVYLGTDSSPDSGEYRGSVSGTSYPYAGLSPDTRYYWRIDAKNSEGTATGGVWSFTTTQGPPCVELTLYRISDDTGTRNSSSPGNIKSEFQPGETARITLRAVNTGSVAPIQTVLNLRGPDDSTICYDSYSNAENNSVDSPLDNGETDYYSFDWIIPAGVESGYYDVMASIRNQADFDTVYDTTEPGANTGFDGDYVLDDMICILVDVNTELEVGAAVFRDGTAGLWHAAVYWFYDGYAKKHRVLQGSIGELSGARDWDRFINDNSFRGSLRIANVPLTGAVCQKIIYGALFNLRAGYWLPAAGNEPNSAWQSGDGEMRCDGLVQAAYGRGLSELFNIPLIWAQTPVNMYLRSDNAFPVTAVRPRALPDTISINRITGEFSIQFSELMSKGTLDPGATAGCITYTGSSSGTHAIDVGYQQEDLWMGYNWLFWHDALHDNNDEHLGGAIDSQNIMPVAVPSAGIRHDVLGINLKPYGSLVEGESVKVVITPSAADLAGNSLLGDNDGVAGDSFVYSFTVPISPASLSLSYSGVAENRPANSVIGTLRTVDPDSDVFKYELVSGPGDDDNALFAINGDLLTAAVAFDYESKNSYSVRIRTTDSDGRFCEALFSITVQNADDQPICFKPEINGTQLTLRWSSFYSHRYTVLYTTRLGQEFRALRTDINATPPENSEVFNISGVGSIFLKVQVQQD